jgi:nucleotide-binding universal stress UspA family protein
MPVLVLREDSSIATERLIKGEQSLRILVPMDGSDYAKAVLAPAAYLASSLTESGNALLCLTHVVQASHDTKGSSRTSASNGKSNEDVQHAKEYIAAMVSNINDGYVAPDIANLHLQVTSSVVAGNDVADELLSLAEQADGAGASKKTDYDMIAMTTHGRSGVQRWATGSVTGRVLHAAHLPLLIVRPADLARNR